MLLIEVENFKKVEQVLKEEILNTSKEERKYFSYNTTTLTYGEITFNGMYKIFQKLRELGFVETFGGVFVDIGHGSGKCVFAACLCHNFQATYGIEILSGLYHQSPWT